MKNPRFRNYIYWGVTALAVIAVSIALAFTISKFQTVKGAMKMLIGILMPIIYGAVLAYLMLPVYNKTRGFLEKLLTGGFKRPGRIRKETEACEEEDDKERAEGAERAGFLRGISKAGATVVCLVLLTVIVVGLFSMIMPQLYDSIMTFQENLGDNINNLALWLEKVLADNPDIEAMVIPTYNELTLRLQTWVSEELVPNLSTISTMSTMSAVLNRLSTGLINVIVLLKNILIGVIVMVYLLNIKESLSAQGKKIVYSIFDVKKGNQCVEEVRFIHHVFGGFITGKLLDSLIIGILSFFIFSVARIPYVLLVSVIIGVTNVIPFFGPFIGAVPSAFLILLISPSKCLLFLVLIIVIQQFDGNILGPKILGQSTGLPSFWVLFSILLFGGLMGFVGMIIAVPVFAVVYSTIDRLVNRSLEQKNLSVNTAEYADLDYIDEEKKTYMK